MKNIIKLLLLWTILSTGCNSNTQGDDFAKFRRNFYKDSLFQINHISFPLQGIYSPRMEMTDTIYIWQQEEDWTYITDPRKDKEIITDVVIQNDTIVEELSHLEYGGFFHLVQFKKIEERWYLTRFEYVI